MRLWKKIALAAGVSALVLAGLFVVFIGPWPVYTSGFEGTGYYARNLAAIEQTARLNHLTSTPGPLKAGWGVARMDLEPGMPLAGYGARHNIKEYLFGEKPKKTATGIHDDLHVKAIALSDGEDVVVIAGADLLIIPPNIADAVRKEVARKTPLTANNLYFGASHTHDGPGGFGEGLAAFFVGGLYNPKVPVILTAAFTDAIVEAYNRLETARMAHGRFDAPQYIRNRARKGPVDSLLSYLVVEKAGGRRCILLNYSAHPTVVGSRFVEFTAEYPGFLQSAIEKAMPDTTVAYLGGALGSSGPVAPDRPNDIERAQAMGEELAGLVMANLHDLKWQTNVDVAAIGIPIELPSFQLRLSHSLRVSPLLPKVLGLPIGGWMHAARVGDLFLVGIPGDFSGEISAQWKRAAADAGYSLWTSSFCAAYIGYISPDKYYDEPNAPHEYETGFMSWIGPHQEAFFTALMERMTGALGAPPFKQAS